MVGRKTADPALASIARPGGAFDRPARRAVRIGAGVAVALITANCGSQKLASGGVDPKYGVSASPRVVAEGEAVPKGGGREMIGRPYVVAGKTYVPREGAGYVREGLASWYGTAFHGRQTANGEVFDRESIAAAHPTLPLPSYTRITNLGNNRSMIVRVNDRGPFHADRILDVSERVAEALAFKHLGTTKVRVEYLGKASVRGSDDAKLLATLRMDGRPATIPGRGSIMLADLKEQWRPPTAPAAEASDPEPAATNLASARSRQAAAPTSGEEGTHVQVSRAPVPPERPFDLATIPSAATPLASSDYQRPADARLPPARPTYAGMFYAAPRPPSRVSEGPFVALKPQRAVSLRQTSETNAAPR